MSGRLIAEFAAPATLQAALPLVRQAGHQTLDAFTPFPIEGLAEQLGMPPPRIRQAMLGGGLIIAAAAFALQCYSAIIAYPIDSGDRPLFSWQVFVLAPFEVGIFAAALCGVIAFLYGCGLPRLHNPLFEISGFERATQDHFFLLAMASDDGDALRDLRRVLERAGAVVVTEIRGP
jgi:ABC-type multidrug transport system permease subunit